MNTQVRKNDTIDAEDVARFSAQSQQWWDADGPFKPLHTITPLRMDYIRMQACAHFGKETDMLRPFDGMDVLDVGCGGGLAAEPMKRMGGNVTGIDASEKNIAIAQSHAEQSGLTIDYHAMTAEALAEQGAQYDIVLALEIIEHVADVPLFLKSLAALTKPGGMVVITTLNRTAKSYALAIIGAEYILRWLPRGTHNWQQFLRPSEVSLPMQSHGFVQADLSGMSYNPFTRTWSLSNDVSVNYLLTFVKQV